MDCSRAPIRRETCEVEIARASAARLKLFRRATSTNRAMSLRRSMAPLKGALSGDARALKAWR